MDTMSAQQRSRLMARIKGRDTGPELLVRHLLHAAGYRYLLQGKLPHRTLEEIRRDHPDVKLPGGKLPGRPDLVFSARAKVVFVNGCFWHLHDCPVGQHAPQTNAEFWESKRTRTRERDARSIAALGELGWESLVLWECELGDRQAVLGRLAGFLGSPRFTGPAILSLPMTDMTRTPRHQVLPGAIQSLNAKSASLLRDPNHTATRW